MRKPEPRTRILIIVLGIVACFLAAWLGFGLYSRIQFQKMDSHYHQPESGLRSFLTAMVIYRETYKTYPPALSALGGSAATCTAGANAASACLIDNVLASGEKSGFAYHYTLKDGAEGFTLNVDPENQNVPQHFFTDQTAVIRVEVGRVATADSPPIKYQ